MSVRFVLTRFVVLMLAAAALVLPACNTVSGAGRDIRSVGNSMECSAEKNR
jgi:predicted small secreted protein